MPKLLPMAIGLGCLLAASAAPADVWKWVDANGKTRYVDSQSPIFTWTDNGGVYFSDTPDHQDALRVQLVWHSAGSLDDAQGSADGDEDQAPEDPEYLAAMEAHCQQITEIHDSYVNAPRMYRDSDDGKREFLTDREVRKAIREIKAARDEACK